MTGITYTPETGLTVPTLTAGAIIDVSMTPGDAAPEACRIVVSGPIRGGERALLATSGPLTAASGWTAELSLATTQVRDLMRGLLPTDSISARVELIDEAAGRYIAGITGKLRNSSLTWAADALSAESFVAGDSLASIRASLAAMQEYVAAALAAASAHAARTDNPHGVTAEQVGALPLSGGTLNGSLSIRGGLTTGAESDVYIGGGILVGNDVRIGYLSTSGQGVSLLGHATATDNPHGVTAAQAVALPLTGGALSGALSVPSLLLSDPSGGRWALTVSASGDLLLSPVNA